MSYAINQYKVNALPSKLQCNSIYYVLNADQTVTQYLTDNNGNPKVVGYPQNDYKQSIVIPRPMIEYRNKGGSTIGGFDTSGNPSFHKLITVHFLPTSPEWLSHEPQLFLFRYKNKRNKRKKVKAWVHPSDTWMVHNNRWFGYPMYGGKQMGFGGVDIRLQHERRTEWLIGENLNDTTFNRNAPYELSPYVRKEIVLNLSSYWNDASTGFDELRFPMSISSFESASRRLTGAKNRASDAKAQYFKFAYAIKNPDFPSNSNNPVLFGDFSDFICVYPKRSKGNYIDIQLKIGYSKEGVI